MPTVTEPRSAPGMSTRTKARKRALDVLYEADLRGEEPQVVLRRRVEWAEPPVRAYTVTLVEGYQQHAEEIDHLLATYSEGWSLARMPAVDRNLLRVAVFELLHADDVDDAVVMSEALELAESLSTDESPKFVNGLLARIAEVVRDRS
ncbi:transcription antitermination factor NusB [Actinocatenispora rupis]|uniref:Transcription antitermination protein NusB n=2 Tax=Actinocatenispora rupis TaxID=519421 RepID=A0A8J3NAL8_9ACTN|nr:N utilization substance protein B [Actinocatenispora rupis]